MPRTRKPPKPLRPSAIINRLTREAPLTPWRATNDPVTELVLTLLSQNTSDTNSGRAFQQLLKRYPNWDAVLEAPVEELEETIRPGGSHEPKPLECKRCWRSYASNWDLTGTPRAWPRCRSTRRRHG